MSPLQHQIRQNRILSILPEHVVERMDLDLVHLTAGQVLADVGQDLRHIYFPLTSIVAWMKMLENGNTIGVAMLGRQGLVSLFALLTARHNRNFKAVVQIGGHALRVPLQSGFQVIQGDSCCISQLMTYAEMRMATVAQNSLCMRNHTLEQQLCRFFLGTLDLIEGQDFSVTHDWIANWLGVRREGVSLAAKRLMRTGAIAYSRGHITVVDRHALEHLTCECYKAIKTEEDKCYAELEARLLSSSAMQDLTAKPSDSESRNGSDLPPCEDPPCA
jgi:CRP-like cAMP-binding protein